jgi:uncharacterized protein DUF2071
MMLQTTVRDCLCLNWALPAAALPEPAAPLRYQLHPWQGRDYVFVSALLFHHDAVHLSALPRLRLGYPQFNLRLCVLDGQGVPSVLCRKMLIPIWVAPGVRLISHQPAAGARLDFPHPSRGLDGGPWSWRVERRGRLEVRAWQDSPRVGEGPNLGPWDRLVRYFQERPRAYVEDGGALHRIEARQPSAAVWPLRVEIGADDLLARLLPLAAAAGHAGDAEEGAPGWPPLHSAWLCPEIPLAFELGIAPPRVPVAQQVPHPAAGRIASPVWQAKALRSSAPRRETVPAEGRRAASC